MLLLRHQTILACITAVSMSACPFDPAHDGITTVGTPPPSAAATHGGLVSIQDVSIAGLPQAGHGLTVIAAFTPWRAPDYEEHPGTPFGCKASLYDLTQEALPREEDHGALQLGGLRGGELTCTYEAARGYVCPTASGSGAISVATDAGVVSYAVDGLQLSAADVGRYLKVSGAAQRDNDGAFAILGVSDVGAALLANPRARAERFTASYTVVAGAGPTPGEGFVPFEASEPVRVALAPNDTSAFAGFAVEVVPGGAFTLDAATIERLTHVAPNNEPLRLGCEACGEAAATLIRINTTDADVSGLAPTAMPPAEHASVEITCAVADADHIEVPAAALALLQTAHEHSPITRIRTAFMREGFALVGADAADGEPRNVVTVVVGHGVLGFSSPAPNP